jgi:hypothetical protein
MPRVLYCARICTLLEPPFPSTPAGQNKPSAAHHGNAATPSMSTTATQGHVDLDDQNSPTSPPPDPSHQL